MRTRARGFTLIELLIVVTIIGIIAAIAVPGLLRARAAGDEASALGSLRAINSGEAAFSGSCASGAYATNLADLQLIPSGATQAFVSPDLASNGVVKSGYRFVLEVDAAPNTKAMSTVTPCVAVVATLSSSYFAKADPLRPMGIRYFATDTRGTIYQGDVPADLGNPIPSGAAPAQ